MKISLSILLALLISVTFAQNQVKIGYTNHELIAYYHPDYQVISKQLQEHQAKIQAMMQQKYQEYQMIDEEYNRIKNLGGNGLMVKDKEQQAYNKQLEIQQFEADAKRSLMEKEQQLLEPLQLKIQEAIKVVALEKGYTHILTQGSLLFMVDEKKHDITDSVLIKLGIDPQKVMNPNATESAAPPGAGGPSGGNKPSMLEVR